MRSKRSARSTVDMQLSSSGHDAGSIPAGRSTPQREST